MHLFHERKLHRCFLTVSFLSSVTLLYVLLGIVYTAIQKEAAHRKHLLDIERHAARAQHEEAERAAQGTFVQREVTYARQDLQTARQTITARTREITWAEGGMVGWLESREMSAKAVALTAQNTATLEPIAGIVSPALNHAVVMQALQTSEERLEEAQQMAHVGSWEFDLTTLKSTWSKEFFALVGVAPDSGELGYPPGLALFTPEDAACVEACIQRTVREGIGYALDVQQAASEGEAPRWYHLVGKPVFDADGKTIGLVGTLLDITERKRYAREMQSANEHLMEANTQLETRILLVNEQGVELEAQNLELNTANVRLEDLAATDGLTGLKNHRVFQERLAEEYQRALRYNAPLSVVLLDVDHFKHFNDMFGHPAGDRVLRKVADILQATGRATDLVARYGGEEFVLLLHETDAQGALTTAERIRHNIASATWEQRAITVSVGAATFEPEVIAAQKLVDLADKALYYSKQQGRNRVTHANELSAVGRYRSVHSTPWCDESPQSLRGLPGC